MCEHAQCSMFEGVLDFVSVPPELKPNAPQNPNPMFNMQCAINSTLLFSDPKNRSAFE